VEAGQNTSTIVLRDVEGNENTRREPVPGDITGHPVAGEHKYRDLVLQVGS
jgi:hypothetical protein